MIWRQAVRAASHAGVVLSALALAGACRGASHGPLPVVQANDNRAGAGSARGDTLVLKLVAQAAEWRPEADSGGPSVAVVAFAEEGRAPQIPAPMIRVHDGTVVDVSVRNALADSTINVIGLRPRPDRTHDTLRVRPGETRRAVFVAGVPGTYLYAALLGKRDLSKDDERETLAGAFIVDPKEGSSPDRVFVINIWGDTKDSVTYPNALAINGRSWPYTERIAGTVGDTLRWRVINASARPHPMHLHGFYFTRVSQGDAFTDTAYTPAMRAMLVTQKMRRGGTMLLTSVPDRAGNWLFHCHIAGHVIPLSARLVTDTTEAAHATMSPDAGRHMAGLVLGITIGARAGAAASREARDRRRLDLYVDEGARRHRAPRGLGYVLQRGPTPPSRDSIEDVGTLLVLTRGQPTDIVVHNRLPQPTSVHWHGIELESYSDGVAGWSGASDHLAPMIPPADSFVAHLTLPRAGTFIYHTHLGDFEQLTSGLYGGMVVTEPGTPFDAAHDHVFVLGWDGMTDPPYILVNGTRIAEPLRLDAGRTHRFRFVSIGAADADGVSLRRGGVPVQWRAVAKDGWSLPAAQAVVKKAVQPLQPGETYDFEFVPVPGEYLLTAIMDDTRPAWRQRIIVR
ncbi:MAG: multicopper oxidase domain-containing protein [Gemmatimonadales bacterium]